MYRLRHENITQASNENYSNIKVKSYVQVKTGIYYTTLRSEAWHLPLRYSAFTYKLRNFEVQFLKFKS